MKQITDKVIQLLNGADYGYNDKCHFGIDVDLISVTIIGEELITMHITMEGDTPVTSKRNASIETFINALNNG